MKKTLCYIFCLVMVLSLFGCTAENQSTESSTAETTVATTTAVATTTQIATTTTIEKTTTTKQATTTTGSTGTTKKQPTTTKKAVKFEDVQKTYYAINNGSIRTAPYDDAKIESRMSRGQAIFVVAKGDNGWWKVKIKDSIRYVWYENLSDKKPTTAKQTLAPTRQKSGSGNVPSKWDDPVTKSTPRKNVDGVLVCGKTAYEHYGFSSGAGDNYASTINRAANLLSGKANVYDIIIPTSIGVMLPSDVRAALGDYDQKKAINYMYGKMNGKVHKVNIYDTLLAHNDEYLYFHSDHHWTARAAYYAYAEYMKAKGATPKALSSYDTICFDGFKGTFYDRVGGGIKVDTCVAYYPDSNTSFYFADSKGNKTNWHVIQDVSNWASSSKYNCFIGGDNAFSEITNNSRSDGGNALVIKESFGNAFVPFLVDHYKHVYIVDYRYYSAMTISKFVDTYKIKDVVFINNIGAASSYNKVSWIADFVG